MLQQLAALLLILTCASVYPVALAAGVWVFDAVGVGVCDGVADGVEDADGVDDGVEDCVGAAPRKTSPRTSLSPTATVIPAFPLEVITKLYTPACAVAL